MTLSLWMIVLSLCAMVIIVESLNWVWIKFWIFCSVMTSMFEVASSKITTLLLRRIARQMQMS
jgi:hypothetical protein